MRFQKLTNCCSIKHLHTLGDVFKTEDAEKTFTKKNLFPGIIAICHEDDEAVKVLKEWGFEQIGTLQSSGARIMFREQNAAEMAEGIKPPYKKKLPAKQSKKHYPILR